MYDSLHSLKLLLRLCFRATRSFRYLWIALWRRFQKVWQPAASNDDSESDESWTACSNVHSPPLVPPRNPEAGEPQSGSSALEKSPVQDNLPSSSFNYGGVAVSSTPKYTLEPIVPAWIDRYETTVVRPQTESHYTVGALDTVFDPDNIPIQWLPSVHPEGALYFSRTYEGAKILTNAHLYNTETLADINTCVMQIDLLISKSNFQLPPNPELVLDLLQDTDGGLICGYYFVDHQNRCLFWVEPFDISNLLTEVKGVTCPSHIRHEMESQYWAHWHLFPDVRKLTPGTLRELRDILAYALGDTLTSTEPTWPYDEAGLSTLLTLVGQIKGDYETNVSYPVARGSPSGHSTALVCRLMSTLCHHRFLNFYGQVSARLDFTQSVHGNKRQRSFLIRILSPLFFYAPEEYLRSLEELWVDQLVRRVSWDKFIGELASEWIELTLYATILLNANVAFLAIPNVDSGQTAHTSSAAQLASYLSITSSLGSIILGLLNSRQNRSESRSYDHAPDFLVRMTHPVHGLEVLAILYALPYILLMWGAVSFLTAVLFLCLVATNTLTRLLVSVAWFLVVTLILCCIWTGWANEGHWWAWASKLWESSRRRKIDNGSLPS